MLQLKKKKKEKKKKKKKHKFIDERGSTIVYNGLVKFNLFSTIVLLVLYISCVFLFFFFKIGRVRLDPKTDPNPRQTRILDPNSTQASIQPA